MALKRLDRRISVTLLPAQLSIQIACTRRSTFRKTCVSNKLSQYPSPYAKRVEYNMFRPSAADKHATVISLDEAEREWLDSMEAGSWPVLPPDFFKRRFVDSGDNAARVEVPLRYTTVAAPSESAKSNGAAA
jgi:hypothetical protein